MLVKGLRTGLPPQMRRCHECGGVRQNTYHNFPSVMEMPEGFDGDIPCRDCLARTSHCSQEQPDHLIAPSRVNRHSDAMCDRTHAE